MVETRSDHLPATGSSSFASCRMLVGQRRYARDARSTTRSTRRPSRQIQSPQRGGVPSSGSARLNGQPLSFLSVRNFKTIINLCDFISGHCQHFILFLFFLQSTLVLFFQRFQVTELPFFLLRLDLFLRSERRNRTGLETVNRGGQTVNR